MTTTITAPHTEPCVKCPECGGILEPDTAEWQLVASATRLYPEEWSAFLFEPCPGCGAEGEVA